MPSASRILLLVAARFLGLTPQAIDWRPLCGLFGGVATEAGEPPALHSPGHLCRLFGGGATGAGGPPALHSPDPLCGLFGGGATVATGAAGAP